MVYTCNGKEIDLNTPCVMGILNLTPDSFYDGGKAGSDKEVLKKIERMLLDGMRILDIGGQSSRPGAKLITAEEELGRIMPYFLQIRKVFPELCISIDTFYAEVARQTLSNGANIINDISGGNSKTLLELVKAYKAGYVLMHIKGSPASMQQKPSYKNVTQEVFGFLRTKAQELEQSGITRLFIDPGFGFGKTLEHNYELMRNLHKLSDSAFPVLVGISRKSMVTGVVGNDPTDALNGTTSLHMIALQHGAKVLRVHDVKEAVAAIKMHTFMLTSKTTA